jgi:hypothetical protein
MLVVQAVRWHRVERLSPAAGPPARRCSACGGSNLGKPVETALDAITRCYYDVVRCQSCGYDLLESCAPVAAASA